MNTETNTGATDTSGTTATDTTGKAAVAATNDGTTTTESTTPEGQGNGETAAATTTTTEGDGSTETVADGAPEAYSDFTLPEGFALEGERLTQAQTLFRELNLPQASAQKLIDAFTDLSGKDSSALTEAIATATEDARAQQIDAWGVQSKTEFGAGYDGMVENARYGVAALETDRPGLKETFNTLGWGNHPDLIYVFNKFGAMLRESGMDTGTSRQTNAGPARQADRMYPDMKP